MSIDRIFPIIIFPKTNKFSPKIPKFPAPTSEPVSQIVPDYLTSTTKPEDYNSRDK